MESRIEQITDIDNRVAVTDWLIWCKDHAEKLDPFEKSLRRPEVNEPGYADVQELRKRPGFIRAFGNTRDEMTGGGGGISDNWQTDRTRVASLGSRFKFSFAPPSLDRNAVHRRDGPFVPNSTYWTLGGPDCVG
ncbi:hypothetical protein A5697_25465 [Mycobacterium sp. E3251]|uniref:hypothetical protein n=1 Tax=Mycobacterium sp. E3251 TaxID=1834144 RepID=UPI0007FC98B3|nr:hypothetical protein [Mycobacterium sp. E3251]OBG94758.1 hypothetical protein A5697_25465 [Mycobacterium sp. E3251]